MRYVCLLALLLPALSSAQDGAAIYKERCASCHDTPAERVPSLTAIKAMSGEAIYAALTTGPMKSRAEGLAITDMFALLGYIAPTGAANAAPVTFSKTCMGDATFKVTAESNLTNARYQDGLKA